jgi:large subunit ribosomal protein L16
MVISRANVNAQRKAIFRVWPKGFKQDIFFKNYFALAPDNLPIFSGYFNNIKNVSRLSRFRAVVVRSNQYGYVSDRSIEAFRKVIAPYFRKKSYTKSAFFIHIYPFVPLTKKPAEVRMGGGKGSKLRGHFSPVKPGQILFSVFMFNPSFSKKLLSYASQKLGLKLSVFIILFYVYTITFQCFLSTIIQNFILSITAVSVNFALLTLIDLRRDKLVICALVV